MLPSHPITKKGLKLPEEALQVRLQILRALDSSPAWLAERLRGEGAWFAPATREMGDGGEF